VARVLRPVAVLQHKQLPFATSGSGIEQENGFDGPNCARRYAVVFSIHRLVGHKRDRKEDTRRIRCLIMVTRCWRRCVIAVSHIHGLLAGNSACFTNRVTVPNLSFMNLMEAFRPAVELMLRSSFAGAGSFYEGMGQESRDGIA